MIHRYPIGIQDFGEIRNGSFVYVDKREYLISAIMGRNILKVSAIMSITMHQKKLTV